MAIHAAEVSGICGIRRMIKIMILKAIFLNWFTQGGKNEADEEGFLEYSLKEDAVDNVNSVQEQSGLVQNEHTKRKLFQ